MANIAVCFARALPILFFPLLVLAGVPTSIFINQVTEYSLLSSCAEVQVSTIIRDMAYGCGDNSQLTSFACFCYESSAHFSSVIGKHVSTACTNDPTQNTTAVDVFSSYCQLGAVAPQSTGTLTTSSVLSTTLASTSTFSTSASPASGPTAPSASATSGPPAGSTPKKKSNTTAIAIACGVAIPVALLSIAAVALFLWRRKTSTALHELAHDNGNNFTEISAGPEHVRNVHELKDTYRYSPPPVELDGGIPRPELGSRDTEREKKA